MKASNFIKPDVVNFDSELLDQLENFHQQILQKSSLIDDISPVTETTMNLPSSFSSGDINSVSVKGVQDIPIGLGIQIDSCFDESLKKKKELHHDFDEQLFLE